MDDSDEEYMARAAVFTEKLLTTLVNSAGESPAADQQQQQRPLIRTSVRIPKEKEVESDINGNSASSSKQEVVLKETSPASSKIQASTVPKSSENDAKSENPVPINKTRPDIPIEVHAETDDKTSKVAPQELEQQEEKQKPARIPRVGFTRVLLPESRSKSMNPAPTKIAVRPSIPEHHKKSFGGTDVPVQIESRVEMPENNLDKLNESRSKSLNRIPENHRKSFGGTANYQKVPIVVAEPMSKEVEVKEEMPQKPGKIQFVESQVITKIRSRSTNPSEQRAENSVSASNVPRSSVSEIHTEPNDQKILKKSEGFGVGTPHVKTFQDFQPQSNSENRSKSANPAQRTQNSESANSVSRPSAPEIHTEPNDQKTLKKTEGFGVGTPHVKTFQDLQPQAKPAQRTENSQSASNVSRPRVPESNDQKIQEKAQGFGIGSNHVKTFQDFEPQLKSENRSKSANPAQSSENSESANNVSRPSVPEIHTESKGQKIPEKTQGFGVGNAHVKTFQDFQPQSNSENRSKSANPAQRTENSVSASNASRPRVPEIHTESSDQKIQKKTEGFGVGTNHVKTFQDFQPQLNSEDRSKSVNPAANNESRPAISKVQTKSFGMPVHQQTPRKSEEAGSIGTPRVKDFQAPQSENSVPTNNESKPAAPQLQAKSFGVNRQKVPEKTEVVRSANNVSIQKVPEVKTESWDQKAPANRSVGNENSVSEAQHSVFSENPLPQRTVPANKASKPSVPAVQKPEETGCSSTTRPSEVQQLNERNLQTCVQQPLMRKSRPLERRVRPILDIPTQIEPPLPPNAEPMQPVIPEQQPLRISPILPVSSVVPTSSAPVNNFSRPRAAAVTRPPEPLQRAVPNYQPLRTRGGPPGFSRAAPRPNQNRPPPPTRPQINDEINQLCAGVQDLTIADPDFHLEDRQRSRVLQPTRFFPILGSSAPVQDQTTWVEEQQTNHRDHQHFPMNNNQYNPGESLFEPSDEEELNDITVEPLNPAGEYPEMFTSFRRQLAEEERNRQLASRDTSIVDLGRANNEPEHPPPPSPIIRSNTPVLRRPQLLPPIAKGRIPERREVLPPSSPLFGPPTNVPTTSNNMPPASFDSADSAMMKPTKEEKKKTEHMESADAKYLTSLSPEDLEKMSEEELQQVTNSFYESGPRLKFKESFPFMAEGVVQKDCETGQLKVYSQRLGRIMLEDSRWKKTEDYVYFVAIKPGVNRGLWFDTHPKCLVSAKFPSVERLVLRGYAILAHPNGSREDSIKESRWICWNDSLGLMSVISGAARTPLKKQPVWDKQLDIVSIHANFENRRFVVTKLVALTNSKEKKEQFPDEVFLVQDAIFKRQCEDDLLFHSAKLNASILIKRTLVGEVHTFEQRAFELVVVPTFPRSNSLEFRSMLIIDNPQKFWKREKEWIRELLLKKTESYCN